MTEIHRPLRLILDGDALVHNWQVLARASGSASTGAAVKADGYGLGAREVVKRLAAAGCRDFFVAQWAEAVAIADLVPPEQIAVLNGLGEGDISVAREVGCLPVLNTPRQIARWREAGGGRCHVMLDSGINRLGVGPEQMNAGLFDGIEVDILMSHLASADEDVPQNGAQLALFNQMSQGVACRRRSLSNSAGIQLGPDYHFDLTRPGISLYGGVVRSECAYDLKQVMKIEAQILQSRDLKAGQQVGYNATFTCSSDIRVGTIAIGYADGYWRGFSNIGSCRNKDHSLPVIGRVSMDLVTIDLKLAPQLREGDWVEVDFNLANAAVSTGLSQYELLTGLNHRFERCWQ